ncbi:amidohydrolase family protein [Lignipirellula cremea]|uniref:Amidohydrolase n=1 Tax=Lignipirellula cremea TaxID=2528010 RepID=A0A518E2W5_9BACT|nr:amidohydrolase family protein [Lignipirellula cremea]QDU98435.1 Amidohydrolase [Lignipirellula cremea]
MWIPQTLRPLLLAAVITSLAIVVPASAQEKKAPTAVKHRIDTHIHLYDTTRPGGVPWPPADDTVLYHPHLPDEYRKEAQAAGVTGVVIVEASDRLEDNRWVLDLVGDDKFFVALVGNIDPYRKDFGQQLKKLRQDKRFVGVRARLQGKKIDYADPQVLASFRQLAEAGLSLDVLMQESTPESVRQVDELARAVPSLRIIVNHVIGFPVNGERPSQDWIEAVHRLAENKNVYCKVSGLYQRCVEQPASQDLELYRPLLDILWTEFGSERLIYGSNWPCTKKSGDYASFLSLVDQYFAGKGPEACERYYWQNAAEAYQLPLK